MLTPKTKSFARFPCLLFHPRLFLAIGALFLTSALAAQTRTLTGRVSANESDSAVTGATVRLKGTNNSTITGADGRFSIKVPAGPAVLVVSSVGYTAQEVPVTQSADVAVHLVTDPQALAQVVVIGYGVSKRSDLTGAISSVSAAQIEKVPTPSIDQAMQGRAAGVQVIANDGAPGGNMSVLIRGVGSLATGGNSPLYVIDGYPVSGGINNINPNDVASIDVLKDASAAAIYGIRAANGVVIITTKRGKKGGSQLSFDMYEAFQSKPKFYKVLNAQQWGTLANEVADADPQHNFNELPIWRTPEQLHSVDWQNTIYRTGLTQNYSIGIRGGSDKVQSGVSVGYYDQKGIVTGSYFKRFTLGLNLDYQPTTWLKSTTNAKYSYQNSNNPFGTGSLIQLAQLPPTLDSGNKLTYQIKDAQGNYGFYNPKNTYVAKFSNPLFSIDNNQYSNITNYLLANSSLEATILPGLKIKTNLGINISMYSGSYYQPEDDRLSDQYNLGGATQNALYSQHLYNTFEWLWENTISYDKTFGKHGIHFVAGISDQSTTNNFMGGQGIPPNSVIRDLAQVRNLQLDAYNSVAGPGNGQQVLTLASQFGRLSYSFLDRYIITGTLRRDGSSKFDQSHQYGVFPSGAIAWKMKEEDFLKDLTWLTELKLRGGYGQLGNQGAIPLYQYQGLYSTGGAASVNPNNYGYPFDKQYENGVAAIQPANPNLKWETDVQTDIGLDAAFLNNRLTLTADWFDRKSKDFLLQLPVSTQTGYTLITRNVGSIENKGLEIALGYNQPINHDMSLNFNLTFTTVNNRLTGLPYPNKYIANFGPSTLTGVSGLGWGIYSETYIGQPVGEFYGYKSIGIIQNQGQIDQLNAAAAQKNPANPYYQKPGTGPGDRLFADLDGDGQVTAVNDQTALGSPLPKFYGGLNVDFTYKAFDINLYFYGVYGNKIMNYVESSLESFQNKSFVGVQNVSQDYYANHWTEQHPSDKYSRATYNDDAIGSGVPSSAWIQNGSFLKLKNLMIGYNLPQSFLRQVHLNRARLYVSSQNLFTITKYTGADPEIGIQMSNATQNGIDNGTYPSSRFFTIGLNIGL